MGIKQLLAGCLSIVITLALAAGTFYAISVTTFAVVKVIFPIVAAFVIIGYLSK